MGLAQKLLVGHRHDHDSGGVITHPRAYELFANAWFFGQRGRVFDKLVAASGAQRGEKVLDIGCGSGYFSRRIAPADGYLSPTSAHPAFPSSKASSAA